METVLGYVRYIPSLLCDTQVIWNKIAHFEHTY